MPELVQRGKVSHQQVVVARRHLQRERNEQPLRGHAFLLHGAAHLFEEHALMRGMLVHQHQAIATLHQHVQLVEDTEDAEVRRDRSG